MTETTTTTMKTRTGLVSPKCFAAPLADCDGGAATREHYISRNLLLRFGDGIWVEGLSWMDVARQLTERTMVSNMLCLKHNSGLSDLDSMIGRFYDVVASAHTGRDSGWHSFEGELLERWALKMMCGLLASGNYGNARGERSEVPLLYLHILFGESSVTDGCGFYYIGDPIDGFDADRLDVDLMRVQPPDPEAGKIYGVIVKLLGFQFAMSVTTPIVEVKKQRVWHRPRGFILGDHGLGGHGCIAMRWRYSESNKVLRLKYGGK